MKRTVVFLAAFTSLLSGVSFATSPASRPLERLWRSADRVVVGRVTDVKASCDQPSGICHRLYRVSLDMSSIKELKPTKGSNANYKSICSNVPLEIGTTYTLFVETPTKFNTRGSDKCLFAIDFDGVFEKIGPDVYRVGAPDAKIIVGYEGDEYLTNAVVEPEFEKTMDSLSQSENNDQ